MGFQLIRPEAIRQDEEWLASLRVLEPHQQMVVVLSKDPNDPYARWSQFRAALPASARKDDPLAAREAALLPDGPAAGPRQAAALGPPADLVGDQPRDLGRPAARADRRRPAAGDARLAPLGRPARDRRRGRAGLRPAPRELPGPVPAGRADRRERDAVRRPSSRPLSRRLPAARSATVDPDDPIGLEHLLGRGLRGRSAGATRPPAPIPATAKKPLFVAGLKPKPGATGDPARRARTTRRWASSGGSAGAGS